MPKDDGLTYKQQRYVDEFLVDLNKTAAYARAGYKVGRTNADTGSRACGLHEKPLIRAAIEKRLADRAAAVGIKASDVLDRWVAQMQADPTKLTKLWHGPCRYCHGKDHAFHWRTVREFEAAKAEAKRNKMPAPKTTGGFGYRLTSDPHPECPECDGLGIPFTRFADTRSIMGNEAALFEGVEEGKVGLKFKLADRSKAVEMVARHLGMLNAKIEHSGKDGTQIEHAVAARVIIVPAKVPSPVLTRPMPHDDED